MSDRTSRFAPLVLSAVALLIAASGVTPSEAARAFQRVLNADSVDGLSASRTPRPNRLLALNSSGRFPPSVLPPIQAARGPRGAEGPRGPAGGQGPVGPQGSPGQRGPRGPSDAFIDRNDTSLSIPSGSPTTVVQVRLPPGAYALDFVAHAWLPSGGTWVDCTIDVGGRQLNHTAIIVGADAAATIEGVIAMTDATTVSVATTVRVLCAERVAETDVRMGDSRLRAIAVGGIDEQ